LCHTEIKHVSILFKSMNDRCTGSLYGNNPVVDITTKLINCTIQNIALAE